MLRFLTGGVFILFALGYGWYTVAAAAHAAHKAFWDYAVLNTANRFGLLTLLWQYSPGAVIAVAVSALTGVAICFVRFDVAGSGS